MQLSQPALNRLFVLFTVFVFLVFVFYRLVFIAYPHPSAAGVDNNIVYFIQKLLDGQKLYSDPAQSPYSVAQYGPLYYYVTAFTCKIAGVGADEVLNIFIVSKIICLFLNLLLAIVIFMTARRVFNFPVARSYFIAFLAFIFIEGNSFARPDSLEHLFFFSSIYFFARGLKKDEDNQKVLFPFVLSAVFAVLAIFSKQSAITLPVIAFLWLAPRYSGRKKFLAYIIGFTATLIIMLLVLGKITGIKNMLLNIVLGLDNGIYWGSYWVDIIVNFYSWYGCLWVVSFIFIYALLLKENRQLYRWLSFALIIQFIFTNLFALKFGSTSNYFTNWWTLLFFGMALYWDKLVVMANGIQKNLALFMLFFLLLLKMTLVVQPSVDKIRTRPQKLAFYNTEAELAAYVRTLHDNSRHFSVFCNLFSPDSYLNNFFFREAIVPQYDIVSLASYPKKVYDYTRLRNDLKNGTVEFIITNDDRKRFMDIELTNYALLEVRGKYNIYRLNNAAPGISK